GVALAGMAIVMANRSKREPRRLTGTTTSAGQPTVARTPTAVRINFSSDPNGASVIRAFDGEELGRTPLSLEVPYSDATVQFVLRRPGYEDKVMLIVPNLPAPIFATLRPVEKTPMANPAPTPAFRRALPPQGGRKPSVVPGPALVPVPPANQQKKHSNAVDEDAVLEPDFK
ncbi:MAG: PEGA domain-containing protein, partial [Deltaproteobacteria bacterium]|nr:PEGA domain-containing protein [Deltaproteobacteria bacterium]